MISKSKGTVPLSDRLIELCLIFLIIFTPLAYGSVHPWAIATFQIIAAFMALIWLLKMLRSGTLEFIRTPINILILIFILYVSLQLFFSHYTLSVIRYASTGTVPEGDCPLITLFATRYLLPSSIYLWATKTELLKIISYALIFLVTLNTIKTKQQITHILSVIITVGFLMSIFYLMRYFGAKAPQGIINPDHFSGYLGMIIPIGLGFLFVPSLSTIRYAAKGLSPKRSEGDCPLITLYSNRFLLFFTIITMSAALFFTMSRGGMFSFIAALLFMAGLTLTRKSIKKKGWILSAVAIFIILTIAWLGATPVVERILSVKVEITSLYFGGRFPIWQGTLKLIKDYPIFGSGLGTFNYIFPKYQSVEIISKHYTYAHSDILEFVSEVGMPFFFLSVVCGLWTMAWLFRRFDRRHDPWVVGMSIGFLGSLASIFVHSFADFNLHIPSNAILLTLILALTPIVLNLKRDKFGERVAFAKRYFRLAKGTVPEGDCPLTILYSLRFIFCLLAIAIISIFTIACVRPALANYYFQQATSSAIGTPPERDRPLIAPLYKAISLDPTNAKYHYYLGKSYSELKDYGSRLTAYKKAIELNPTNSKSHQSLAWTYGVLADLNRRNNYYSRGLIDLAHKHFQQAIHLEPNNPYRHRTYAIYCFNQAKSINSDTNKMTNSINSKVALLNTAISEYRQAVNIDSSFAEEAIEKLFFFTKDYNKLTQILPDLPEFHLTLASFLQDKDVWIENKTKFKGDMDKATEKALYYIAIARWHYQCKDYNRAFSILYDCLSLYPDNARIHFTIADFAVYGAGNWEIAFREYEEALGLEPENVWYRYWYAVNLFRNQKYLESERQFKKVIKLDPSYSNRIEIFKSSGGKKAE